MKKSANVDISNLFRKFGGDTGSYQEIQQDYIGEKAQKNWPIVQAVEKERAVAPRLKMAHHVAPQAASHPAEAGHVPHHHAPAAQAAPRPLFGGLGEQAKPASTLFAAAEKPAAVSPLFAAAEKPAAVSPLFGAQPSPSAEKPASLLFGAAEKPAPAASQSGAADRPAGSLFNTLGAARQAQAGVPPAVGGSAAQGEPVQARRPESDALNAVFSRLLNPQQAPAAAAPENNLRSMLGFLTK